MKTSWIEGASKQEIAFRLDTPSLFFISLVGTKAGNAYLRITFFTVPSVILRMFKPFCRPSVRIPSTR